MSPSLLNITPELTASVATKTAAVKTLLTDIAGHWSPAAFANSLGAEDMVLTDLIVKARLPIEIFSLDTGRLPLETYDLMAAVREERTNQGIAQETLAHMAGIERSHMGKIERGEHVPTLPLILKIARALKCSSAHLMTLTEAKLAESAPSAD